MQDIFSSLARAGISSEENYLTESFVYVLKLLLIHQPALGLQIINQLCDLPDQLVDPVGIDILTQANYQSGRPDIEIRSGSDTLILVEVKHDSPLGFYQLERYYAELQQSGAPQTRLVFLTRSRMAAQSTSLSPEKYVHRCWYQVNDWLINAEITEPVCKHIVDDFLIFLEGKKMSHKKVTWEYMEGVLALNNLIAMLETAVVDLWPKLKTRRTAGWNWKGLYLDSSVWCWIRYNRPLEVVLENNLGNNPTYKQSLDLLESHFFALSQGEQLECLINFLKTAYPDAPKPQSPNGLDFPTDDEEEAGM
jgi:hypothetical protein